jgi:predicted GIY-YIG superfamily endonuclease
MKDYNGIVNYNDSEDDYMIYIMYSTDPSDKSIYIGVTEDYKQRIKKHSDGRKRKMYKDKPLYTWMNNVIDVMNLKVVFEILEKNLSSDDAFLKEEEYIKLYKNLKYNVLNLTNGGKGVKGKSPWNKGKVGVYSKNHLKKLSNSNKGKVSPMKGKTLSFERRKQVSENNKDRVGKEWNNPLRRNILKYSSEMQLVDIYHSLKHASISEKVHPASIGKWCRGENQPKNGFIYKYENK